MKHQLIPSLGLLAAFFLFSAPARAEIDLGVSALVGTGVATGDADNNPYALQLGAAGELVINHVVLGVRGTRSMENNSCDSPCRNVKDLRSFGGDLGYEWDLLLLHIGPRFGFGYLNERDGKLASGYMEPGMVADIELAIFSLGAEFRYRFAPKENDLNGFLAYARLGLRF